MVHANGVKAALAAGLATAGSRVPILWLKHDYSWDGPLARVVALRSRRVVAVSSAITTTFGPRLSRRVTVVPNGVPEYRRERDRGRAVVQELTGAGPAPVVLLVGRLHPAKGQIELVEAAPAVLERRPDTRFLLLGDEDPTQPAYAVAVRRRIEELGVGGAFSLPGHRDDPLLVMSGADLMVLPSVPDERGAGKEACPFALLEAMSVQTAVTAYAAGGIPEVLGDCGRLVAEGDRDALAEAIAALVADEDARTAAADCGLARVRERHSADRYRRRDEGDLRGHRPLRMTVDRRTLIRRAAQAGALGSAVTVGLACDSGPASAASAIKAEDVKRHGAAGDGRRDDTEAIRKALAAVPDDGGSVFFPPGDYLISGQLEPKSQTLIFGCHSPRYEPVANPGSACKLRAAARFDGSGLIAPGGSTQGVTLRNLALAGDGNAPAGLRLPPLAT